MCVCAWGVRSIYVWCGHMFHMRLLVVVWLYMGCVVYLLGWALCRALPLYVYSRVARSGPVRYVAPCDMGALERG